MNFTFTDKTSYLAWRQEWKTNYAYLTNVIRAQKHSRKQYLRVYQIIRTNRGKVRQLISKTANPLCGKFNPSQFVSFRREAKMQLEILVEARALSYEMKRARAASPSEENQSPTA